MIQDLMIQAIGFLGVVCFILSFQIKSNRALFFMQMLGSAVFCLQFFLLGGISGCLSLLTFILRNVLLLQIHRWEWVAWKGWIGIFGIVYVVILVVAWQGPVSFLPFVAGVVSTIGAWTNNAQKIRLANLACVSPCWLVYDVLIGSWAGVLNESVILCSILVSIFRYGWKAMGDPDSEFQKSGRKE